MFLTVVNAYPRSREAKRRRIGPGCILGCLTTLVLILLIAGVGWLFLLRPYLHDLAQTQLNRAMTAAVNQIPAQAAQLPSGSTLQIQETSITNLIVDNIAPADPIKSPVAHITTQNVRLEFQLYGYPCAITAVPQISHGKFIVGNVTIEGIFGLVMSPDEMATLLNNHLADAENRLQHTVSAVQLQKQSLKLTLS